MPFTKITETDLQNKGVIGLPDTPGLSTTEMQEKFDEIALDVLAPKHNGLIDELALSSAAANIGALDVNNEASTVQAELNKLKQGGYTKAETDALLANKVDSQSGKGLSTNDFTDAYKDKLNGIEDNANNYVLPKGSQTTLGGVMGDGSTFTIDSNGVGHAVGGGGGGTSDYNALINKPKINNVEVIGDKSGSDFGFLSPVITITSDAGSTVKIKKGTTEIDAVPVTTTTWKAVPSDYGTWTVSSTLAGADEATGTVTVDAVKQYSVTVEHITATITATYPNDATYCTCSKGSTTYTATSNPQTFTVRATGTWTVETSLNGIVKSATTTISADGDSQSVSIEYADIEVTYDNNFKGKTITCTNGTLTYTKTAPSDANTVSFTIPSTGTWTVRSEVSGTTYSQNVSVLSYTSYSASLAVFNATITITFPYSNGATCKLSDGVTELVANTSPMAFNVPNVGTWVATCTLDGLAQTESFSITTDGQTETHTFEYGTINLTFDNEFRGLTLTCTDSSYTITKTAPSTGNTMVFYPNETNTWTISGTYSGVTYTTTAEVSSLSTPVSAILQTIPDGSTVTPTDAIQTWLKCAAINDKSYTTLNEVLADTDTFTALLQDSNACDYMARSTTWAVAEGAVPTMTSDTTPSGECICDSYVTGENAYKAFDNNTSTFWESNAASSTSGGKWIGYTFTTPKDIVMLKHRTSAGAIQNVKVQYSDDKSTWTDTGDTYTVTSSDGTKCVSVTSSGSHLHWRVYLVSASSNTRFATHILQFYEDADITSNSDAMARVGKYDYCSDALLGNSTWCSAIGSSTYFESVLNTKVPTMTSNTTPSGEVIYSPIYSTFYAYYGFDNNGSTEYASSVSGKNDTAYLGYDFTENVTVCKYYALVKGASSLTVNYKVQGSNDKSTWETLAEHNVTYTATTETIQGTFNNSTAYRYYRLLKDVSVSDCRFEVYTLQFYGRHEAQTNIIHSAASDTLYYIDGSNQTIGTTDTSGVGSVTWSNVPVGNLTIYSSVAHDPDDLTSAYSKTVRITPNTVEVYVMPDEVKTLYWYGYDSGDIEDCTSANGWSNTGLTFSAPTHNTNDITLYSGAAEQGQGVGTKNTVSGTTFNAIAQGITIASNEYGLIQAPSSKYNFIGVDFVPINSSNISLITKTFSGSKYLVAEVNYTRSSKIYAMWYE